MKKLLLSIHDASPFFLKELKIIFRELDKLKVSRYNILITPLWDNKYNIDKNPEFIKLIKRHSLNSRIALHGYTHMSDSGPYKFLGKITGLGSEYLEFDNISEKETEDKIKKGLKLLKKAFKIKPEGFVPPMWSFPVSNKRILKKYFRYYTTLFHLDYFGHKITALPIAYDAGKNRIASKFIQIVSSLRIRLKKEGVIRFSIHPMDITQGGLKHIIKDLNFLLENGWELCLKEDLYS